MKDATTTYAQMGMASLLPGMQYMVELMQKQLDEMRDHLAALQNGGAPKRLGRPPKSAVAADSVRAARRSGASGAWANLTAEQRSEEMKRRQAVGRANAKQADRKNGAATRWANLTKKARAEMLVKMQAGRRRNQARLKNAAGQVAA
jgi:hypothetical protein